MLEEAAQDSPWSLARVAGGFVTASRAVDAALARLERTQEATNACVAILPEAARMRAAELERGSDRGTLHGVPFAVKDAFDVRGIPTNGCSRGYRRPPATGDAAAVRRLAAAGAVLVAKTNQHELATGATNLVSAAGPTKNPWDRSRMTGGSSGGSAAAVAARAVPFALGTDAGGSIRIPASLCGVTGLKPTYGSVSLQGVMRTARSVDVAGPIAVTADDCLRVFRVIREPDVPARTAAARRIGLPRRHFTLVQSEVRTAVDRAAGVFESLGFAVEELGGPDPDEGVEALDAIAVAEVAYERRDLDAPAEIDPHLSALIEAGARMTALDYLDARERADRLRAEFRAVFEQVDLLLTPATPYVAPRADEEQIAVEGGSLDAQTALARLTNGVSVVGLPAIAFPVGLGAHGLPVGAQLVGPWGSDELLCAVAASFQAVTSHHLRAPGMMNA